jgi:hypothetical protein
MGRRLRRRGRRRACRPARRASGRRRSAGSARRTRARAPRAARSGRRLPGRRARALRGHAPWNLPSYPALSPAQYAPSSPYPDQAPRAPPRQQSTGHTHTHSLRSRLPRAHPTAHPRAPRGSRPAARRRRAGPPPRARPPSAAGLPASPGAPARSAEPAPLFPYGARHEHEPADPQRPLRAAQAQDRHRLVARATVAIGLEHGGARHLLAAAAAQVGREHKVGLQRQRQRDLPRRAQPRASPLL